MSDRLISLRTENETDGRVFSIDNPVLLRIVQIQIHLAGIRVIEPAELKVDEDQASEPSMKQKQVDTKPLVPDPKTLLARDEGEFASKFEREFLQMLDKRIFQFTLGVFVLQVQELGN